MEGPKLTAILWSGIQGILDCLAAREREVVSSGAPMKDGEKDSGHKRTKSSRQISEIHFVRVIFPIPFFDKLKIESNIEIERGSLTV